MAGSEHRSESVTQFVPSPGGKDSQRLSWPEGKNNTRLNNVEERSSATSVAPRAQGVSITGENLGGLSSVFSASVKPLGLGVPRNQQDRLILPDESTCH